MFHLLYMLHSNARDRNCGTYGHSLYSMLRFFMLLLLPFSANLYSSGQETGKPGTLVLRDSLKNDTYEKMQALDLPEIEKDSISPLFSRCFYCQKQNRLWYSDISEACNAARTCGYDYIEFRYDQMFLDSNAAVMVTTYCSFQNDSIFLDSIACVQRTKTSGRQTVVQVPHSERNIFFMPASAPVRNQKKNNSCAELYDLASKISGFCSSAGYSRSTNSFKFKFMLNGTAWLMINGKFLPANKTNADFKSSSCSSFRTYYRLCTFSGNTQCQDSTNNINADSSISISLKQHYYFNQCIIDYRILSGNGVKEISFSSGNIIDKKLNFYGEKKVTGSVPLGIGKKKAVLFVTATDINGLSVEKRITIFEKTEKQYEEFRHAETIHKARKAWTRKNIVNRSLDIISRFEGNIVSPLLDLYCAGQAREYLLKIPDTYNKDSVRSFSLPASGRAPFFLSGPDSGLVSLYTYNTAIKYLDIATNGTIVKRLDVPSLIKSASCTYLDLHCMIALGKGYYDAEYFSKGESTHENPHAADVVVCSDIIKLKDGYSLSEIPYIFGDPASSVDFYVFINQEKESADTLVITYAAECLDRTKYIMYRSVAIDADGNGILKRDEKKSSGISVLAENTIDTKVNNGRFVISREHVSCDRKMAAIYIFIYSSSAGATIGEGAVFSRK
ncbi:MAG TPA: hypothetical protein DCO75_06620 [Fibrobacteres bacterium]|nr:hypothetical protein [Fibrobacterota bacterium]